VMRHILLDRARRRIAAKRGRGAPDLTRRISGGNTPKLNHQAVA
jgi:hypothetical protein